MDMDISDMTAAKHFIPKDKWIQLSCEVKRTISNKEQIKEAVSLHCALKAVFHSVTFQYIL